MVARNHTSVYYQVHCLKRASILQNFYQALLKSLWSSSWQHQVMPYELLCLDTVLQPWDLEFERSTPPYGTMSLQQGFQTLFFRAFVGFLLHFDFAKPGASLALHWGRKMKDMYRCGAPCLESTSRARSFTRAMLKLSGQRMPKMGLKA